MPHNHAEADSKEKCHIRKGEVHHPTKVAALAPQSRLEEILRQLETVPPPRFEIASRNREYLHSFLFVRGGERYRPGTQTIKPVSTRRQTRLRYR